ncbi:glycine betaine/L-proline ABC transporter permease ProW [Ottowia pentelensis]|uniref:Glycine betaine/L-proline ABC transporter permease ProW n=1 Tax=Ottowia pentelensis TaxID=511108 RepID=A0ABV6PTD5_9BURK
MSETTNDPWSAATSGPAAADAANPYQAADAALNPYEAAPPPPGSDAWLSGGTPAPGGSDFLAGAATATPPADPGWSIGQLWDGSLPVQDWINQGLDWLVLHFRPVLHSLRGPVDALLGGVEAALQYPPTGVMIALLSLLAWQLAGKALGLATLVSLAVVAVLGIWPEAMVTLSLVLTSLLFCVLIGLPLGIWLARSERAQKWVRPILDAMQTTPAFVYLVPVVMLFGIGNVPGVIVTIIFALPPLVRLTNLGIRQVRPDLVEAARAYGASPWQLLVKVQLPLAMPSIMAGINQTLMLSLSMVVIASMIAVGGLGLMVLRGIGRLDMGLAAVGGLGIVILAIVLDRITQTMGQPRRDQRQRWFQRGPVGLLRRLVGARPAAPALPAASATPVAPAAPAASPSHA